MESHCINEAKDCASTDFIKLGTLLTTQLLEIEKSEDSWTALNTSPDGDTVFAADTSPRKIMIRGKLATSVENIATELIEKCESMGEWNSTVTECRIVEKLGPETDITYQVMTAGNGLLPPRDFITLRRFTKFGDGCLVLAIQSVEYPIESDDSSVVRGQHGVSGWVLYPQPDGNALVSWVIDVDLNTGWLLPASLIEKGVIKMALKTLVNLRNKLVLKR